MFKNDKIKECPCGSSKIYDECCEPIILGRLSASTAEDLMRARYSAYVKHKIDFIAESSLREKGQNEIDMEETRRWSEESDWHGLKILSAEGGGPNDSEGTVQFTASYTRKGLKDTHKEQASFIKKDGTWLYASGKVTPVTVVREGKKTGRNEACPCGSGKKYKQCCGR